MNDDTNDKPTAPPMRVAMRKEPPTMTSYGARMHIRAENLTHLTDIKNQRLEQMDTPAPSENPAIYRLRRPVARARISYRTLWCQSLCS